MKRLLPRLLSVFILLVLLGIIFFVSAYPIQITNAAESSNNINITANVINGCNCMYAGIDTLNFGQYNSTSGNTAETVITVNAPIGHHYTLHLDGGKHKGKGPAADDLNGQHHGSPRAMAGDGGASTTNFLSYFIHLRKYGAPYYDSEPEDREEWGDNGSTYSALPASAWGTGEGSPHHAYGYLPPRQNVPAGSYCDLVLVKIDN